MGKAGWMTSPTKWDTDGEWASDGSEIKTLHTDPLLADTDHDGVANGKDVDPLHDLVLQVRLTYTFFVDGCVSQCPQYDTHVGIDPNWTRTESIDHSTNWYGNHILSVNVPDDRGHFFYLLFGLWMTLNIVRFYIALPAAPLLAPLGPFLAETLYRIVLTVAVNILVTTVVGAGIVFVFLPQADPFWREGRLGKSRRYWDGSPLPTAPQVSSRNWVHDGRWRLHARTG